MDIPKTFLEYLKLREETTSGDIAGVDARYPDDKNDKPKKRVVKPVTAQNHSV